MGRALARCGAPNAVINRWLFLHFHSLLVFAFPVKYFSLPERTQRRRKAPTSAALAASIRDRLRLNFNSRVLNWGVSRSLSLQPPAICSSSHHHTMANWIDFVSLFITLSIAASIVAGLLYVGRATSRAAERAKESLKHKGVNVSREGVSVKTNKRWDRSDYLDATQRGFVKAYNLSSHGPGADARSHSSESVHSLHLPHSHHGSESGKK